MRNLIIRLANLANQLDEKGFKIEANSLDRLIKKAKVIVDSSLSKNFFDYWLKEATKHNLLNPLQVQHFQSVLANSGINAVFEEVEKMEKGQDLENLFVLICDTTGQEDKCHKE